MKKSNYSSIETILNIAKKCSMCILVDDEKRENEGDGRRISNNENKISCLNNFESIEIDRNPYA